MRGLALIAWKSGWSRRLTLSMVIGSIALSTMLLLTIERVRTDVRDSFAQSVSSTDLIVGARTGPIQLMLYAVFRIGGATNNIRMSSLKAIAEIQTVAWVVPLSLGDSHHGYPVLATNEGYFQHFMYADHRHLEAKDGRTFAPFPEGLYETVIGSEVARKLNYHLGDRITLSHGIGPIPGAEHADKPFEIVGILAATGTPVDRTVHISLEAMEAIHIDWVAGAPIPGTAVGADAARHMDLQPKEATAALIGLKSRAAVFSVQREIAEYSAEPIMAVLPGVALDELWDALGAGEKALFGVSALVAVVSLTGLVTVILAGLNERRREIAVLRSVGAGPWQVLLLLAAEGAIVTLLGAAIGLIASLLLAALAGPLLQSYLDVTLRVSPPTVTQWGLLLAVVLAGFFGSLIPGVTAYRLSLSDGLSPRT